MKATINNIVVEGTAEEIVRYQELLENKKTCYSVIGDSGLKNCKCVIGGDSTTN